MKNVKNPLNYPDYLRGIPPAEPESFSKYTITELEKIQNSMVGLSLASYNYTKARVDTVIEQVEADTESLAARIDTVQAELGDTNAAITDEARARASADSALATRTTNLETTVGGHTASISTLQSSVDGLNLKYSVTLDSNGYITGFEQNNNGKTGQFIIRADVFKVVSPGQTARTMFQVDASGVHYTGKASVTGLTSGTLNADISMGAGRIIWDNGSFMKVAGVGFGSSNQFIEWFGPKMAISACSEANAISYLKTNGDAYFGGSLSAGVLKNAVQTTSISATASVTSDPFKSNGKSRTVTLSYSFRMNGQRTSPGTVSGTFDVGTVTLQRSLNDGATWDTVTTMPITSENFRMGNLTGPGSFQATPTEPLSYIMAAGQSVTITDSVLTTGNLMYRALLSGRTVYVISGDSRTPDEVSQSISILSVEQ